MADLSSLKTLGKPLAVLGLGISGKAVAEACLASGIAFDAWDDNENRRNDYKDRFSIHDFSDDLSGYAALIPAAGIKPSHPILQKAKAQKIQILSDIDLLLQSAPEAHVIGITGTNGKSTTTALIGHILKENKINAAVGGNIGQAACSLPSLDQSGVYVLELSSYQLEITARPIADIAVFLNFAPDHLDWHESEENYFLSKRRIAVPRNDRPKQHIILGIDTNRTAQLAEQLKSSPFHQVTEISTRSEPHSGHITVKNNILYDGLEKIIDLNGQQFLRGAHNHENMAAGYAALRIFGLTAEQILPPLLTFEGLPYRQKKIGQWRDIAFINDSKATNADATSRALDSFNDIYWIIGGLAKEDGIDGLEKYYPKIRHAFLIGDASKRFAEQLKGRLPYTECGTLTKALTEAFLLAQKNNTPATILLSPACASFDQYKNFEERGNEFTALVQNLLQKAAA